MLNLSNSSIDELPTDGYGFESHEYDADADYYAGHAKHYFNKTIRDKKFVIWEGEYESPSLTYIYVEMWNEKKSTKLGVLDAWLLTREYGQNIFQTADIPSQEVCDMAREFFNADEMLVPKITSQILGNDHDRINAANEGDILYINEVHVAKFSRGQGLSLEIIRGLFEHLENRWAISAFFPAPWGVQDQNRHGFHNEEAFIAAKEIPTEKIARLFAKLGYIQVGTSHYWFLERSHVSEYDLDTSKLVISKDPERPKTPVFEGVDQELLDWLTAEQVSDISTLDSLLARGASLEKIFALHHAAVAHNFEMVEFLVNNYDLDVNLQDHHGNTPLHLATESLKMKFFLVSHGANVDVKNIDDKKPIDKLLEEIEDMKKYRMAFFIPTFSIDRWTEEMSKFLLTSFSEPSAKNQALRELHAGLKECDNELKIKAEELTIEPTYLNKLLNDYKVLSDVLAACEKL
ncbi:hypothetical protein HK100_009203 [Physocladia obscura]|uniref:Ankyrin repeat domain-containing protein n=1 Tax=Physocladia obscura TaxID=109957 RepID=A0AAD5T426_9FUNG|nr:hypothetical protein HK100_009203 [Physocladia obscura]